jgi:hypothetical protein
VSVRRHAAVAAVVWFVSVALAAAENGEPARVYTNADLLPFGPPSTPVPAVVQEDPGWTFVVDFIERERARIDAERALELERRHAAVAEAEAARDGAAVYGYGYGYYGYGYDDGFVDACDHDRGDACRQARPRAAALRPRAGIVPLHARPSDAMVMRARATLRSGVDAFPSNARRGD